MESIDIKEEIESKESLEDLKKDLAPKVTSLKRSNENRNVINETDPSPSKIPRLENCQSIWKQLVQITENLIRISDNINIKERNDILMILSSDPERIAVFENDYGLQQVQLAMKEATKLIYSNDVVDQHYLWLERDGVYHQSTKGWLKRKAFRSEYKAIMSIGEKLFIDYIFDIHEFQRLSFAVMAQKSEFLVLMLVDPHHLRGKQVYRELGQSRVEIGISLSVHILERVLKNCSHLSLAEFLHLRNKVITKHRRHYLCKVIPNYNEMFPQMCAIVRKYWQSEHDDQIQALTVLVFMAPNLVHSRFLLNEEQLSNDDLNALLDEVTTFSSLFICDHQMVQRKIFKREVDEGSPSRIPIIAQLQFPTQSQRKQFRKYFRLGMNFQRDYHILEFNCNTVACSDEETLKWLKTISIHKFQSLDPISIATIQFNCQTLKVAMLSQRRFTDKSFGDLIKIIKAQYPDLCTELWIPLRPKSPWKMDVQIDIRSVSVLEQHNRRICVGELLLKFEIIYTRQNE